MSKFVIECPACGRYAQAKTGFFARKKVECACGHMIDIPTEKMLARQCPHCGNEVVFNQSKGAKAKCPVCGEPINTMAEQSQKVEFSCAQCGVRLQTGKNAATYICPVCDFENDVQERVATEKIKKDGLASIIKYEGDNETLIWKHPIEDFNFGSQLIVHESQEAIFFRDGQALDLFGAGRYTLETQQLPLLEKFYKLPTDTEGTFHSEVYYINLATQMGIKWGTDSKVRLFDPASGLHMELGASGEFNIRVTDSRKLLLKVVGTTGSLLQEQLLGSGGSKGFFRSMVMTQVKSYLARTIRENAINILEIDEHLMGLSEALREKINQGLADYGLTMPEFFVARIVTPDDDLNFRKMKEQYAQQYLLVRQEQIRKSEAEAAQQRMAVEAETQARMKIIGAQGEAEALKIQKAAEAEAYRMQAEAEAMEMRMKGFNQKDVIQADVQKAYAAGLGQMGSNGGGLGEIAGLGVTLGAMGGVMGLTREAMAPISGMNQTVLASGEPGWDCSCGHKGITSKFCPNCGSPKPQSGWICPQCGRTGITSNFCPDCGSRKSSEGWNCSCGQQGITSNFCPNCGSRKPEEGWSCPDCGSTDITGKFCPNCGHKRED